MQDYKLVIHVVLHVQSFVLHVRYAWFEGTRFQKSNNPLSRRNPCCLPDLRTPRSRRLSLADLVLRNFPNIKSNDPSGTELGFRLLAPLPAPSRLLPGNARPQDCRSRRRRRRRLRAMGTERKRKVSLFDVVDETSVSAKLRAATNGAAAAAATPAINRWNGRPFSARYHEILEKRRTLPVWQQKDEFLRVLRDNQTLILVGETGSGKTTQVR
jgi:hypothetical protein